MCFSATASFSVAAATVVIGVAALKHVKHPQELPLALVPFLFAFQQTVEGILWLQLSGDSGSDGNGGVSALSLTFLVFAEVLWPAYTAPAVLLIEPDPRRRRVLAVIAVIGLVLSAHLLTGLLDDPRTASIRGHSVAYGVGANPLSWQQLPYLLCTCAPLLLSSHRTLQILGAIVAAGFLISAYVYLTTFTSVWCFFVAADSTLLYFYFRHAAVGGRLRPT